MRVTRRYWAIAGFGGVFVGLAVLFARPLLLLGAVSLGAWLLVHQYAFLRMLRRLPAIMTVDQSLSTDQARTTDDITLTLTAELITPTPLTVTITATPPIGTAEATDADRTIRLGQPTREATTTFTLHCPTAGTYDFDPPQTHITDPLGLFVKTGHYGSAPSLTVEPRGPHNLHVGGGGDRIIRPYGEHETAHRGAGIETTGVREYVPTDPLRHIDWNTTARLNAPHVREYLTKTDHMTALVVDHRADMGNGAEHETPLAYARQLALTILTTAEERNDPIGLYTIGDDGLTNRIAPDTGRTTYETIRRRLHALTPTHPAASPSDTSNSPSGIRPPRRPTTAVKAADSPFTATLAAYLDPTRSYLERLPANPLLQTIENYLLGVAGSIQLLVFTHDAHRAELYDLVNLTRDRDANLGLFLTPHVLFEPHQPVDLDATYDRYLDFEEFRRFLDRLAWVSAYEVGPSDRLDAIIAARQHERHTTHNRP